PPRERARFQGYFAAVFTLAAVGGPVMGGLVVAHLSWRVLFWINLPLAAFAVWRLRQLQHPAHPARADSRVDWLGLGLFPFCVACTIYWLSAVQHRFAWQAPVSIALVLTVLIGMLVLLHHERRHSQPFLDLELLSQPAIRAALICTTVFAACMFALVFFLPIYMQLFLKSSAVKSGLLMLPLSSGIVLGATTGGRAMAMGVLPKWVPAVGLAVSATALGLLAWLGAEPKMIASLGVVTGLGFGTVMPTTQIIVQTVAGRGRLATATSLASLSRSMGAAAGTTVFGALIFGLLPSLPAGASARDFLLLPPSDIQFAFHLVFVLMAVTCAAGALVAARAPVVRI
ncbi:MAG: MFS transporter, partial [Paucibacter sp.]|nr:MFS transporter [Roseateles sp.]